MSALQNRIISARTLIAGSGAANDVRAVSDYYLGSGDKCGPQTITGERAEMTWRRKSAELGIWDILSLTITCSQVGHRMWITPEQRMLWRRGQGSRNQTHKTCNSKKPMHLRFNSGSGIYTPIIAGYYHVCSYARYTFLYLKIDNKRGNLDTL